MTAGTDEMQSGTVQLVGKLAAFALFAAVLWMPAPAGLPLEAKRLAAVTVLMGTLWLTQAIPIAATSLIPLAAFPFLGIQTADAVSKSYINKSVFLFLGGFIIALGIEKWGLHRRIALHIVRLLGTSLKKVVLGFMVATAFLSMWISNTASTLLMLPIGLAMLTSLKDLCEESIDHGSEAGRQQGAQTELALSRLAVVLMLGIAYSASIGGFTTLVGTPTNVQFLQIWSDRFPEAPEFSAGDWIMAVGPLGLVLLFCAWWILVRRLPQLPGVQSLDRSFFTARLRAMGPPTRAEIRMFLVFAVTAALWILRTPLKVGQEPLLPGWGDGVTQLLIAAGATREMAHAAIHDSTVAMGMSILMFFIPAERSSKGATKYLMDWTTAETLPWGILLLIGGGFALASAFHETGLSEYIGDGFAQGVQGWPSWLLVAAICLLMTLLTEFTSNVATISTVLPIVAEIALRIHVDPRLIMIPATVSTSCAFMLPIATPPNAIIFGSGKVTMGQMARYGVTLNLIGVVLVTLATFVLITPQLGISLNALPDWVGVATGH